MKTRQEMQLEARRIEEISQQPTDNHRFENRSGVALTASASPLVLFSFPESTVRINAASEFEGPLTHRMVRRIEFAQNDPEGEYKLVEEEFVSSPDGELVRHYDRTELEASDDAFDVLLAGYERLDEDRLRERIEPVVDRLEANTFPEPVTRQSLEEVERLVSDMALSPAAKMRMKMDAVAFLEGRLEAGDFVARTVARQECFQSEHTMVVGERISEAIEVS